MSRNGFVPWPADAALTYRERGVWKGLPLGEALDRAAQDAADRVAVVDGDRRVSYAELRALSSQFASAILRRGIADGARVIFQLPNVVEFVIAYVGCLKVGAIPIACHPHQREAEIAALARHSGASAWIFADNLRGFDFAAMARSVVAEVPTVRELWTIGRAGPGASSWTDLLASGERADPECARHVPSPSSPAVFQLSGGTTGLPKLIARTHDDYLYNSLAFAEASRFQSDDVLLVSIPVAHNFALACPGLQGALLLGATTVLAPLPAADVVFPLIARERVTWIPAVPATLIRWTQDPARSQHDLSSLRAIYVGGQRLSPQAARAAVGAFGPVVHQVFGMAEGLLCCTRAGDLEAVKVETQGRPVSTLDEIRVVDDAGCDVGPGAIGELLARGPYTIRGYYNAEAHNAVAFTDDGFFRTGDMVSLTEDGNLVVEGRKKDLINRGGEKISAEEVENLILAHPAVAIAAVVAMPDPVLGERACACVVLRAGATLVLDQLAAFLRAQKISSFKLPERLEIFEALPLTGVGKVSKTELRAIVKRRLEEPSPA